MATAPSFITEQETAWNGTTPKSVAASITAVTNDILVEVAGMEQSTLSNLGTPTGGTSVTRTARATEDANSGNTCEARAWTAPITSDQTFTPSFNTNGTLFYEGTALLFRGSDGVGAATSTNNGTGSGAPSLNITTTQDNSAIVVVVVDWNAVDGASRVWSTVNGITPTAGNGYERSYNLDAARGTYYVAYYPDAGAAGVKTVGLSAPSTQRYVICAVEIKGAASVGRSWVPEGRNTRLAVPIQRGPFSAHFMPQSGAFIVGVTAFSFPTAGWVWNARAPVDQLQLTTAQKPWQWNGQAPVDQLKLTPPQKPWQWLGQAPVNRLGLVLPQKPWLWSPQAPADKLQLTGQQKAVAWNAQAPVNSLAITAAQKPVSWTARSPILSMALTAAQKAWNWITASPNMAGGSFDPLPILRYIGAIRRRRSRPPM